MNNECAKCGVFCWDYRLYCEDCKLILPTELRQRLVRVEFNLESNQDARLVAQHYQPVERAITADEARQRLNILREYSDLITECKGFNSDQIRLHATNTEC